MKWPILLLFAASGFAAADPAADLLAAVRNGDHTRVKKLLAEKVSPKTADSDGTTALMHSVIESDLDMMRMLIDAGADVNAANTAGSTALMYAAVNLSKTKLLLDRGANATLANKRGVNAMDVAVTTYGSTPVLKLLAAKGAKPGERVMAPPAEKGDLEAMQYLLSIGASPGGEDSAAVLAAVGARCDACLRLLVEKGAPINGLRNGVFGVLGQAAKRAMPETSQYLLDHGAKLDVADRENFTLLMQAVLSLEPPAQRDRMVEWLISKHVDLEAKTTRGETAYVFAARAGAKSTMDVLVKAGAKPVHEDYPKPAGAASPEDAVRKILPSIEKSGEAIFKNRGCVSCHNNSLAAMTVALARRKGFKVDEEQARKELGFAVATDKPYFEQMRLGTTIGGGSTTVAVTLMGMAAAGYPADNFTDSHLNYLALQQMPDGSWQTTAYRPPTEYSPVTTTAAAIRAIELYPIPGRKAEFDDRVKRARKYLLGYKPSSTEERVMQLDGLAWGGASAAERAPITRALAALQNADGSWSEVAGPAGDAYSTGSALYALHESGNMAAGDPVYRKGIDWLLKNQLADGSWFVPVRTAPIQPYFETGFPHSQHQFISDAASSWSAMALLLTLPDARQVSR